MSRYLIAIFVLLLSASCSMKNDGDNHELPLSTESDQIVLDEQLDGESIEPILDQKVYDFLSKCDIEYGFAIVPVEEMFYEPDDIDEVDYTLTGGDSLDMRPLLIPTFLGLAI